MTIEEKKKKKNVKRICIGLAGPPREVCALIGLHERPAVLEAEDVPRVPVVRVVGDLGLLLDGKWVVVVVHDHTEILVLDNTRATRSKYLAVAREEHGATSLLARLSVGVNL